jgi:hypothetical protein
MNVAAVDMHQKGGPQMMRLKRIGVSLAIANGAIAAGGFGLRSWLVHWGATQDEIERTLPGDELVPNVRTQATMAVTIAAPPAAVWPWLVQMGVDRAGLYSYLFVENTLLRLGVTNADRIVPEWQDLKVGDHIWFTPEDYPTPRMGPVVAALEPNRALILRHGELDGPCHGTWQFVLDGLPDGGTRLLLRERHSADDPLLATLPNLLLEPGYFLMDRGMLRGIKARAEQGMAAAAPQMKVETNVASVRAHAPA